MKARNMALCALFAALLALCAWICVPVGSLVFTLQTLGVCLALLLLGGKGGCLAIFLYLCLGAAGLPVFSGFRGGLGMLLGATGGYLLGFLPMGAAYWFITSLAGEKAKLPALLAGLSLCYITGLLWAAFGWSSGASLWTLLCATALPYLLPDILKLLAALFLARRLRRFV